MSERALSQFEAIVAGQHKQHHDIYARNMTKREHFACQAMQALLAQHETDITESGIPCLDPRWENAKALTREAVEIADALIEALK